MPVATKSFRASLLVVTLAAFAAPAHAGDGVFEINQTCATTTGCFPGDSAGFPVTIENSGSYALTSDLTLSTATQGGISVSTSDPPIVTIDLRGFAITGVVTCTGEPAACTGIGTGDGIRGVGSTTIRNGTVRGMGDAGVATGAGSTVENMLVEQNGGAGIQLSAAGGSRRAAVRGCRVIKNGGLGLSVAWQDGDGSYAGLVITGNLVAGNGGYGIQAHGAAVVGNVVANNLQQGLAAGSSSGYADNLLFGNNGGNANAQVNGGNEIGGNLCGDDAVCP